MICKELVRAKEALEKKGKPRTFCWLYISPKLDSKIEVIRKSLREGKERVI